MKNLPFIISSIAVLSLLLLSAGAGAFATIDHAVIDVGGGMAAGISRHVEDLAVLQAEAAEESAYPHRRVLQGNSRYITTKTLNSGRQACFNPCAARGDSYTGRGCQKKYGCR